MRISATDLNAYRDEISAIGQDAARYVVESLRDVHGGVGKIRDAAVDAVTETVDIQGEEAQALSAQLYDEVCAAEGIDTEPAKLFDGLIDELLTYEKVHYYSNKLMAGRDDDFASDCAELADYYVKRVAGDNTIRNCAANGVRYARVPTGPDTCDWCVMLASRGFVYHTEDSALAARHHGCDCVVCAGRETTVIEGYDPELYYEMWRDSGFMPSSGGGAAKFRRSDAKPKRGKRGGTDYVDHAVQDEVERFAYAKDSAELEKMLEDARVRLANVDMDPTRWARLWDFYRVSRSRFR